MDESSKNFGGTSGAIAPRARFVYSYEEWCQIAAGIGEYPEGLREELEFLAEAYLASKTQFDLVAEADEKTLKRVALHSRGLIDALSLPGILGDNSDLIETLVDLASRASWASSPEGPGPQHLNANRPWSEYLYEICLFWSNRLDRPVKQRRRVGNSDAPYGPCLEFLMAVAGPVKRVRAPENSKPMTPDMALHAIRNFQARREWEIANRFRARDRALENAKTPEEFSRIEDDWLRANRDWARENGY